MADIKIVLAGCVIVDDYDRILLLHRSGGERPQWELPGGKVEPAEVPESVAVLELREQLGVDIRLTAHLGSGEYEDGEDTYQHQWFQARIIAHQLEITDPETYDDFDYFEPEDMMSLALSPGMELLLSKIIDGEVAVQSESGV